MQKEVLKLQSALTNNIKNAQANGRCTKNADGKKSVWKKSWYRRKETGDLVRLCGNKMEKLKHARHSGWKSTRERRLKVSMNTKLQKASTNLHDRECS